MIKGSCHCGKTQFEVSEAPTSVTRCTCTFCSKRGVLWAYYKPEQFKLTTPIENMTLYQRSVNKHYFCPNCGCGTYTEAPDWTAGEVNYENLKPQINVRLLDDFDLDAVPVTVVDGKNLW